jgi:hypothetical protein
MSKLPLMKEITPEHLKCFPNCCPSVFVKENGSIVIIGTKLSEEYLLQIKDRVADNEFAIEIAPAYLKNIL